MEGDIVELQCLYAVPTEHAMTTFGFLLLDGTGTHADLAADFETNVGAAFTAPMHNTCALYQINVLSVYPDTEASVERLLSPYIFGSAGATGDVLPPQSAAVITWHTALKGRSYRGRSYLSGIGETGQAQGLWVAGTVTALGTWAAAINARYGNGGISTKYQLGVISRFHNRIKRPNPIWTAVTGYTVRSAVRTQRRRQAA